MLFSIIIPVYNVEKYLRDCLDSVLGQTYHDWEAICIDDGSTDGSGTILEEYAGKDLRFKVVTKANGGLSSARNAGLEEAIGDYILFLDSDDWLEPDALQVLANSISDEDMICFNGRRFFEGNGQYEQADTLAPKEYSTGWDYYSENALCGRHFAFVCVVLRCYKRKYLNDNNLSFKAGIYHEDNLFTPLACYFAQKVKVITDVLYDYRVRDSSIMTSRSVKHWKDIIETANALAGFFVPIDGIEKRTVYQALTHHYQAAFANTSSAEDKELQPLVNWRLYRKVSRTKMRHRVQYLALRVSPVLFRIISKIF